MPTGWRSYDVIVVGGGPAGSSCATFCALRGLRVALLDRASFPRHKVCGDFLNPRCWELFERLNVAERVLALQHHETPGFLFSTVEGKTIQVEFAAETRKLHRCVAVSRQLLDHCLLQRAREAGVDVREATTVVGLSRGRQWSVETEGESLSADVLVGADGRHSFVGRRAGLLRREARDERVGMQFHFRCADSMSDCIQLHQLQSGYCGATKIHDNVANICMVVPRHLAGDAGPHSLQSNPVLARSLAGAELLEKPRSITPILGSEFLASGNGALLVGDAARVIEPFTGQGIWFALRSGELAADAIARGGLPGYERALETEYAAHARTNRLFRQVLWRDWAVRGLARIADLRPRWMKAIVGSVIHGA